MDTRLGFQYCHLFTPLLGLMASRYRGGDAFTPAPGGRVSHPHGHLVIMVLMACASFTKPAFLKYCYSFRQNESHINTYFIPLIILGVVTTYFKNLPLAFVPLLSLVALSLMLIGYIPFIKGCRLYITSKGHSSKWGFLGLFYLPGLSILLLVPTRRNGVKSETLESEGSENDPFKRINLLELFVCLITLPFLFILILGIFSLLNNLNFLNLLENPSYNNPFSILLAGCFAFIILREFQNSGLSFNQIIGDRKHIDLKLIGLIVVLELAFNRGFNSLLLYNLSFVFPEYVEDFLNQKDFTNISELIALSFSVVILAPLIEEFFFRGIVLQKWVIKWGGQK